MDLVHSTYTTDVKKIRIPLRRFYVTGSGALSFTIQKNSAHTLICGFPEGRRMFVNVRAFSGRDLDVWGQSIRLCRGDADTAGSTTDVKASGCHWDGSTATGFVIQ